MNPWELLAGVMVRQRNVIATWQAEAVGVHRYELSRRVRREAWVRHHRGVIGSPAAPDAMRTLQAAVLAFARPTAAASRIAIPDDPTDAEHIAAVVEAAMGAGHAVSGRSGAWLHGFAQRPKEHELWLPHQSGRVTRRGVRTRYGGAPAGAIVRRDGMPVLDPLGCIAETARTPIGTYSTRVDEIVWQLARADSLRLLRVDDELLDRIAAFSGCCGSDVLTEAAEKAAGTFSHSRPEGRGRELVQQALEPLRLRVEAQPYEVWHEGQLIAEADIAVVAIKLDYEVDGPHHNVLAQRMADQTRDRKLRRVMWEVERFPDDLVTDRPKVFMARVRDAAEIRMAHLGM